MLNRFNVINLYNIRYMHGVTILVTFAIEIGVIILPVYIRTAHNTAPRTRFGMANYLNFTCYMYIYLYMCKSRFCEC